MRRAEKLDVMDKEGTGKKGKKEGKTRKSYETGRKKGELRERT